MHPRQTFCFQLQHSIERSRWEVFMLLLGACYEPLQISLWLLCQYQRLPERVGCRVWSWSPLLVGFPKVSSLIIVGMSLWQAGLGDLEHSHYVPHFPTETGGSVSLIWAGWLDSQALRRQLTCQSPSTLLFMYHHMVQSAPWTPHPHLNVCVLARRRHNE